MNEMNELMKFRKHLNLILKKVQQTYFNSPTKTTKKNQASSYYYQFEGTIMFATNQDLSLKIKVTLILAHVYKNKNSHLTMVSVLG